MLTSHDAEKAETTLKIRKVPWLTALTQPAIVYLLAGYVVVYGCFFLVPVFLNSDRVMQFAQYIPTYDPIGNDWRISKSNLESWYATGSLIDPLEIPYPPLAYLAVFPLPTNIGTISAARPNANTLITVIISYDSLASV